MLGYIIRRLILAVIIVVGVAFVTFLMLHYLDPRPAQTILTKASPEAIKQWDQQHGYTKPVLVQFVHYLGRLFQGNFGYSYKQGQTVSALFKEAAPRSIYLSGMALILSLMLAIPLGILQAVKRNSPLDYTLTAWNFTLYSMPSFLLGLILIDVFGLSLHIFPVGVSSSITTAWQAFVHPKQLFLPILTLTAINIASFSRYMRSSALDNLAMDYIRLARAKGLSERIVLRKHLMRNAMLPMITLVGLSVPSLLAGNLLIEYLFNFPGLGLLFYNALNNSDYDIMLAYTLLGALLTVIGNLLADITIAITDPRVRL